MDNITVFDSNGNSIQNLVQWDRDVYINITESDITKAYDVHFFNEKLDESLVINSTYSGETLKVKIPNILLTQNYPIFGYVNVTNNAESKSLYSFMIVVKAKPKPSDYPYIEAEVSASEAKKAQQAAEEAASKAAQSKTGADTAKKGADDAASRAAASATEASGYKDQAKTSASNAQSDAAAAKKSAGEAANSAASALESKNAAASSENKAKGYSDNADTKATQAAADAERAKNAATSAEGFKDAALDAQNKAEAAQKEAASSQEAAQRSENAAADSAQSSQESADLARSWAEGGTGKRDGEEENNSKYWAEQSAASKLGADEANEAAQSAKTDAQTAKDGAETAAGQAATDAGRAETAAESAEASETQAQEYMTQAGASASAADTSAQAAEKSELAAATSETNAKKWQDLAESYAHGQTEQRPEEETDNAMYYCNEAKKSAEKVEAAIGGDFILESDKGVPDGVATLDGIGKLTETQIPDNVLTEADKGVPDGVATLDGTEKIPSEQLPVATADAIGGVKSGGGITVAEDGAVTVNPEGHTHEFIQNADGSVKVTPGNSADKHSSFVRFDVTAEESNISRADMGVNDATGQAFIHSFSKSDETDLGYNLIYDTKHKPTPSDIGALATDGDSANNVATFTSGDVEDAEATKWTSVEPVASGEKHSSIFSKMSNMFKNVRYLFKTLGSADFSGVGATVTDALVALQKNKINVTDIVNSLVGTATDKPLSALQGKTLADQIAKLNTDKYVDYSSQLATSAFCVGIPYLLVWKCNHFVFMRISFQSQNLTGAFDDVIFTIDSEYAPKVDSYFTIIARNQGNWAVATYYNANIMIATTGEIHLMYNSENAKNTQHINGSITYVV